MMIISFYFALINSQTQNLITLKSKRRKKSTLSFELLKIFRKIPQITFCSAVAIGWWIQRRYLDCMHHL